MLLTLMLLGGCVVDFGDLASGFPDPPAPEVSIDTASGTAIVDMEGLAFIQDEIVIPAGGTVRWVNHDTAFHIIAEGEPGGAEPEWDSEAVQLGEFFERQFTEPGTYIYYCENHDRLMKDAVIIVE